MEGITEVLRNTFKKIGKIIKSCFTCKCFEFAHFYVAEQPVKKETENNSFKMTAIPQGDEIIVRLAIMF